MKIEIDDLEISGAPSDARPFTNPKAKPKRSVKVNEKAYIVAVTSGSKSLWLKRHGKDWITISIDDIVEALAPILDSRPFTPYEEPRGSKGVPKVEI